MWKIVRWQFTIAVVVLLLGAPFALAQTGERLPKAKRLLNALNGYFHCNESAQVTLRQSLMLFEDQATAQGQFLTIDIDVASIRRERPDLADLENLQVKLMRKDRPDLLKVALQQILIQYDLAFSIVEGRVLVGPPKTVFERAIGQRVNLNADGVPLRKVLKQLADRTGVNLVLDTRIKEEPKVTMEASEMSLKTAVRLLAEMADLKAVLLKGDGYFLTTKERAEQLRKEQLQEDVPAQERGPGVGALAGGLVTPKVSSSR